MTEQDQAKLDEKATHCCGGDIAMWFHHRALLLGEWEICQRGDVHWVSYCRTKALKQHADVEKSVIQGWRRFVCNTFDIPLEKQRDSYTINRALVFNALLRHRGKSHVADVFKRRSELFYAAAKEGDLDFFRAVGRSLSDRGNGNCRNKSEYIPAMLSRWLTDTFWLMPAKLVSQRLSVGLNGPDNIKTLLADKSRYGLKSHRPTLIKQFHKLPDGTETVVLTSGGKLLLG